MWSAEAEQFFDEYVVVEREFLILNDGDIVFAVDHGLDYFYELVPADQANDPYP